MDNIPYFMIAFFLLTLAVQIMVRRSNNGFEQMKKEFAEREMKANNTRIKGIDESLFVIPDTTGLPFREYEETEENKRIIKKQTAVSKKSAFKMIRFPEVMTNTDIKLNYGANNFDMLIMYEEHYNGYIRALLEWGEELIKMDMSDDAQMVLQNAVDFNSDLGKTYTLLAKIYYEKNEREKLKDLASAAKRSRLKLKDKTVKEIEGYIYGE
ncbi:MAG: hypothetical protein IJ583_17130 [Firmicutes bacterium]|nr:hypothetical protein [Bacillota bacterium]